MVNMIKQILKIILLSIFLQCTGEISSLWIVEWKISTKEQIEFKRLEQDFSVLLDARTSSSKSSISDSGNLYNQITIYGYNFVQVEDIQPSFQFKLFTDTTVFFDTALTWDEMAFDGNVSRKFFMLP